MQIDVYFMYTISESGTAGFSRGDSGDYGARGRLRKAYRNKIIGAGDKMDIAQHTSDDTII